MMHIDLREITEEFKFVFPMVDIGMKYITDVMEATLQAVIEINNINSLVEMGLVNTPKINPTLDNIHAISLDFDMEDTTLTRYVMSICVTHVPPELFYDTLGISNLYVIKERNHTLELIIK